MNFSIRPAASGGWLAFTSGSLLLVVPDGATDVAASWSAVGSTSGFQAVLDLLTGKGLAATPSFVLVDWQPDGAARVLLRGEATLEVTDAAGEQSLTATGVSTWVERSLPGVTALAFAVPGASPASSTLLPLVAGVALVAAIASDGAAVPVVAAPSAAAPAASEPELQPEPTPAPEPVVEVDIGETVREAFESVARPEEPERAAPAAEQSATQADGYDYLFGDTMYRGVLDAAVREPDAEDEAEASGPADAAVVDDTLHDGETVMVDSIKKLRGKRRPAQGEAPAAEAAPRLVLVMPGGAREALNQPILIGRSPTVGKVSGPIPRPLTLGPGDQDISRNHAQFTLEGGTVVVTDLHSRNGTSIVLPGKSPQKLRAGEPTSVIVGTVVDFGSGLEIRVEEEA